MSFFNFRHEHAENWWDRAGFAGTLWRLAEFDSHWSPPFYPDYRWAIDPKRNPHIARMDPRFLLTTGVRRSTRPSAKADVYEIDQTLTGDFKFDRPVAASILLFPPHSPNKTALLALLRCVNDPESLERHLDRVAEQLLEAGYNRLVVPGGISPYLNSGLLLDRWNLLPPLHTPNNPPFLPDLISEFLQPGELSRLYHFDIPRAASPGAAKAGHTVQAYLHGPQQDPGNGSKSGFQIVPGEPARLAGDLLPLFLETMPARIGLPEPDRIEAEFLLRWIGRWPLFVWLAIAGDKAVGYILLQPDLAPRLKKARGGRSLLWRVWLNQVRGRPARKGRLLFGGVLPDWQGRGIGRDLIHRALLFARDQGWERLSIGPVPASSATAQFLEKSGAQPLQTYRLFEWDSGA